MASRVKRSMEARNCIFRTDSCIFRKGKIMGAQRSNLPPNFLKIENYQHQNSPKSAEVARNLRSMEKLHGCTKTRKLCKSCAPQHRNFLVGLIAKYWWYCQFYDKMWKIGEGVVGFWPLTNSILLFRFQTMVQSFIKIDWKLRLYERWQTDRQMWGFDEA